MTTKTVISRTFVRATQGPILAGMTDPDDEHGFDVTGFNSDDIVPVRFIADDRRGPCDPFHLARDVWERMGEPGRIRVSVEAGD